MTEGSARAVPVHFSPEAIQSRVAQQEQLRRILRVRSLVEGNDGLAFSHRNAPVAPGAVPALYLAGGMVPSLAVYQDGGRITKQSWQYKVIEETGGAVFAEKTWGAVLPGVRFGNAVFENPLINGFATNRIFTRLDYVNMVIADGSINFVQAGYNREGNPGFAQLAEIVAIFSHGGLNITYNEKGEINKGKPGLYDKDAAIFDHFASPECRVSSLDEAIALVNHDEGKTLNALLRDAREKHDAYEREAHAARADKRVPRVFIGGASKDDWTRRVVEECKGMGVEYLLARDVVDSSVDPVSYVRQMDQCDIAVIYQSAAVNRVSNRLLPLAESGHAVVTLTPVIHISELETVMKDVHAQHPELADPSVKTIFKRETSFAGGERRTAKERYNNARYRGPDFISEAPFTKTYLHVELGRALYDLRRMTELLR